MSISFKDYPISEEIMRALDGLSYQIEQRFNQK